MRERQRTQEEPDIRLSLHPRRREREMREREMRGRGSDCVCASSERSAGLRDWGEMYVSDELRKRMETQTKRRETEGAEKKRRE